MCETLSFITFLSTFFTGCDLAKNSEWINYFTHPCDESRVVYVVFDQPHVLKSLASMFRADHEFLLPKEFLEKHGLNPNYKYAKLEHVRMLLNFQEKSLFKLSPQLTEECINPGHFKV